MSPDQIGDQTGPAAADPAVQGPDSPTPTPTAPRPGSIVISVDAMGGDRGPAAVVAGMADALSRQPDLAFLLHGRPADLEPLLAKRPELAAVTTLCPATEVVTMEDKPSQVMRHGQATSMWSAIDAVKEGHAGAAVSCGNTGALMAVSMLRLRKLPGVNRPAIACLWPNRGPQGFAVMLDVGADVKAEAPDLLAYALMGASYARNGLGLKRPRVGLLNVGSEDHKGRAEVREAQDLLMAATESGGFDYVGFVEGSDLPSGRVDVVVTDGFTGNIALKTGEGTAKQIGEYLRAAMARTWRSRLGYLLARNAFSTLREKMDPRKSNGAVFLGLNGVVIKSHGGTDPLGFASAVDVAYDMARYDLQSKIRSMLDAYHASRPEAPAAPLEAAS